MFFTIYMPKIIIHETFQQTIQGEGHWAGTPADFIRLAGCPVKCPWCDTGYGDGGIGLPRIPKSIEELMAELRSPLVVITGGEPFINPRLIDLIESIGLMGKKVSIETSGAFWQNIPDWVWLTLSPKTHVSPNYPVQPQMWQRANEIKIIISNGLELDYYAPYLPNNVPIFLQPEWSNKEQTIPLVLELLKQFPHYRLSLQLHKYLGVP